MAEVLAFVVTAILVVLTLFIKAKFRKIIVQEFETGLLYRNGKLVRELPSGVCWLFFYNATLEKFDKREQLYVIPGQDLLTMDNVGLKVSASLTFKIADARKAHETTQSYGQAIYAAVHTALRSTFSQTKIDDVLAKRNELGTELLKLVQQRGREIGIEILQVEIRDIMFPAELKKIFNEVVRAQKESQANLERTRGETAALRNLANAAKLVEECPALLQLRTLQTFGSAMATSGNTLVVGLPNYTGANFGSANASNKKD